MHPLPMGIYLHQRQYHSHSQHYLKQPSNVMRRGLLFGGGKAKLLAAVDARESVLSGEIFHEKGREKSICTL